MSLLGAFGIYGHGNVACIGQAMEEFQDQLPGYRGHHEQNYGTNRNCLCTSYAKKQILLQLILLSGATNMVTAAAVALSNRLPILLLPGDTFSSRFQILTNKLVP